MTAIEAQRDAALRDALSRDARSLRRGLSVPVDLGAVAQRLGVSMEPGARGILPAEGALVLGPDGWTIAVSSPDYRRPRTRFTVAHEIGHLMLERYGVSPPVGRGAYWRTEALCHFFAGHLLVPDAGVRWVAEGVAGGPSDLLRRSARLSCKLLVSPQALSHRLNQDLEFCAFCEVKLDSPRAGVVGVVDWSIERFSWLRMGARAQVHGSHFVSRLLAVQRRLRPGQVSAGLLNGLPTAGLRRSRSVWMLGLEPALAADPLQLRPAQLPLPLGGGS